MLNVLKLSLLLIASHLLSNPDMANPDVLWSYDGNVVGLTDAVHHEVLPATFSRMDYIGHGLFMAWGVNPFDKFAYGEDRTLFNKDGKKLDVVVPDGGRLVQVLWLGEESDRDPALELKELPSRAIFRYSKDRKFGLCDAKGVNVLAADYGFIGTSNKGKAVVTDHALFTSAGEGVYIFDCALRKLNQLPLQNVVSADQLCLSEGLMAYPARHDITSAQACYLDESGKYKFAISATKTGAFNQGMASITVQNAPRDLPPFVPHRTGSAIINTSGEIISPTNLEVQDFYGDYAIARDIQKNPTRYGVVNRQFKFVVQPIYASLRAEFDTPSIVLQSIAEPFEKFPAFYVAQEWVGQPEKLISPSGKILLTLPHGYFFEGLLCDGTVQCAVKTATGPSRTWLDMSGKEHLDHLKNEYDSQQHLISYRPVTKDRVLKIVTMDGGHFDSEYWKTNHLRPIGRHQMFGRFLRDYNLIGMPRENLVRLLGNGVKQRSTNDETCKYLLDPTCLGTPMLVIQLRDEKVWSWYTVYSNKTSELVTTNAVFTGSDIYERRNDTKPKP